MRHQFWSIDGFFDEDGKRLYSTSLLLHGMKPWEGMAEADVMKGIMAGLQGHPVGLTWFFDDLLTGGPSIVWITDEQLGMAFCKAADEYRKMGEGKYVIEPHADAPGIGDVERSLLRLHVRLPEMSAPGITFQFPELWQDWGLDGASPDLAAGAITLYECLLDTRVLYRPSGTGLRAIRGYYAKIGKLDCLRPPSDLAPFEEHQPRAILWCRDLLKSEEGARYLHAYDKRASYLHAADVRLGMGDAQHLVLPDPAPLAMPGVSRCEFFGHSKNDLALARCARTDCGTLEGWFYTPMVKALYGLKYNFLVKEGWYFPESRVILRHWRELMLQGLELANGQNPYLKAMLKATYTRAIGLMGSKTFSKDTLYRPDWRGQIVDEASARMLFNVDRVARLGAEYQAKAINGMLTCHLLPAAIYDDCLYYPSASPDPYAATPILTEGGNLTAKFQYKGSYTLNEESRELLKGKPARFARDIKQFQIGGIHGEPS